MTLESGRKMGLTASLIHVITPVIMIILLFALIFSQIARYPVSGPSMFTSGLTIATFLLLGAVAFAGFILFFIAMYRLSHYYNEPKIFKNVLYGLISTIIGGVTALIVEFAFFATVIGRMTPGSTAGVNAAWFAQFMFTLIAIVGIALVFGITAAVLYWRAFNKLAEKSGVETFRTAGLLYLIGTVLSIIGIGVILIWITWIYAANGFRALKPQAATSTSTYPSATPSNVTAKKYCPYCGTENYPDAVYCKNCGKQIQ